MGKLSGRPRLMDQPRHQHELFQAGLKNLESYSVSTKPEKYLWIGSNETKQIIDGFSKELTGRLYAEIKVLLKLSDLDSGGYEKTWFKAEAVAKQSDKFTLLFEIVPMILGYAERLSYLE
ncbi:hypothetical protein F4680DRAFT_429456 [Xylaria scruposa]|nr:hypothetical protein F4680DRAFT_429456 [Xylaria scruposa]